MYNDPFLNILPSLDLHGNTRDMVFVLVDEFINDNIKLKNKKIVIVHGKGRGIIKDVLHEQLRSDRRVSKYYLDNFNNGCTIVELL